jgi:hypothetical protein
MLPVRAIDGKSSGTVADLVGSEVVDIPGELLKRFQNDELYTKLGPRVLVSLNSDPVRRGSLEAASKTFAAAAKAYDLEGLGASIFSTSSSAYLHMVKDGADQAILLWYVIFSSSSTNQWAQLSFMAVPSTVASRDPEKHSQKIY